MEGALDLLQDAKDAEAGLTGGTPRTIEGPLYVAGAPLAQGEALREAHARGKNPQPALALVLLYMVLASQFDSFLQPFIVMLAQPLAIVGGVAALWATGQTLNIYSMIGLVLLIKRKRPAMAGPAGSSATETAVTTASAPETPASEAPAAPRPTRKSHIPYGVGIAFAGFDFFLISQHSPFAPLWPWMQ